MINLAIVVDFRFTIVLIVLIVGTLLSILRASLLAASAVETPPSDLQPQPVQFGFDRSNSQRY